MSSHLTSFPHRAGDSSLWVVPVTITTQSSPLTPVKSVVMEERTLTVTLDVAEGEWVKVRLGQVYCIVCDVESWRVTRFVT